MLFYWGYVKFFSYGDSTIVAPSVTTYDCRYVRCIFNHIIALDIIVYKFILRASQYNATLQIMSSYTKQKAINIFIFTLLYLRRVKPLQYINPPIIVCFPERNGAFHCAAIYVPYAIYKSTNNGEYIKHRAKIPYENKTIPNLNTKPRRYLRGYFDEKRLDEIF